MGLQRALTVVLAVLMAAPAGGVPAGAEPAPLAAGAVYRDAGLNAYVGRVGGRLLAAAGLRGADWRFAVLDSPEANAFVLPGREIVITRGMLALVNDEAELAVVLAHEIGHAVAGHGAARRAVDRRAAELEADRLGMAYLAAAGYDAGAQVDVLRTLLASQVLEATLVGGDPALAGRGDGDHPALSDRLREAARAAARFGRIGTGAARDGGRARGPFLAAIDGMVFGDGPAQGFLRGRTFVHPELRFAFDPPPGYAIVNQPEVVTAEGPREAMLLLDSRPDPGVDPAAYVIRGWVPEIAQGVAAQAVEGPRSMRIGGLPAAQARVALASGSSRRVADLTVVRYGRELYRLTGLYEPGDAAAAAALAKAAASFRPLTRAEAARAAPLRIRIHRIAAGDDVAAMARGMPVGAASRAKFDLLNGLTPGRSLRVGDAIKLVSQ
jgi:predicted Zn-dependent protease